MLAKGVPAGRGMVVLAFAMLACMLAAGAAPERAAAATDCSITAPANVTANTLPNSATAVVVYPAPTVSGTCNTISCTPPSGAQYGVGTTMVTCTATTTPQVKASFLVTVNDVQPPVVTVPADIAVGNDPGKASATVTFAPPGVSDNVPTGTSVGCDHVSGDIFALGTTSITCIGRDASGNTAAAGFTVNVNDVEAPVIELAPNIKVNAKGSKGKKVTYDLPGAHDNSAVSPTVGCTPASGIRFAIGKTAVTCTATDAAGNSATKAFTVNVKRRKHR